MAEFNAAQIIGKTLWAKTTIKGNYRYPGSVEIIQFNRGQNVGRVYSYIRDAGKTKLFWQFFTGDDPKNGKPYYVEHHEGIFDLTSIKEQGAKTIKQEVEEKKEKEEYEEKGWLRFYVEKYAPKVALYAGIYFVGKEIIEVAFKDKK